MWNLAAALKLVWILFFKQDSIWSSWYITEVLEGDLNNFWVINTKQKYSWLANQLILLRDYTYSWIRRDIGNGETTYFWSSNWSPFGNISHFLQDESTLRVGIPRSATLAELWEIDHWVLPPARSDKQVRIYAFLSTLVLTETSDLYIWCLGGHPSLNYSTRHIYDIL